MFLAKVKKRIIATKKHPAYQGRHVYVVQPVDPEGSKSGDEWIAMDYVGAGLGDRVVCGGAPGVAMEIFHEPHAPIRTLIMAIVDAVHYNDG